MRTVLRVIIVKILLHNREIGTSRILRLLKVLGVNHHRVDIVAGL
jgi:hypothetical protein